MPFDDLRPAVDAAYRKVAQQVRVTGFRPGKVPPRIIDQCVGRGAVLEEAVNEALPGLYGDAVREQELDTLGQPEIEVTQFTDGDELIFTAEVDVRPTLELPDYDALAVTVDDAEVNDEEVDEQLDGLRDRFGTLAGVERAAASGDYVSLDLSATIDGEPVEDASADSLSYEVGSDSLIHGLDDAIIGLSAGESKEFETQLRSGDHGGETRGRDRDGSGGQGEASPRARRRLRADRERVRHHRRVARPTSGRGWSRMKLLEQGMQARDKVHRDAARAHRVPGPRVVLERRGRLPRAAARPAARLGHPTRRCTTSPRARPARSSTPRCGRTPRTAIKSQFILDAIADKEELRVAEAELTEYLVRQAEQYGMPPRSSPAGHAGGQAAALIAEVRRDKALALLWSRRRSPTPRATPVDLAALRTAAAETSSTRARTTDDDDASRTSRSRSSTGGR